LMSWILDPFRFKPAATKCYEAKRMQKQVIVETNLPT
jgi:hypothetical protein